MSDFEIVEWLPRADTHLHQDLDGLSEVLHACVHAGASVSFILPFSTSDALAFWRDKVLPTVTARSRRVLLARLPGGRIAGTVQLDLATPPNQCHRAEVMKLLVHPTARRAGIARALMVAVEEAAHEEGRTLITLDTASDAAERLYASLGYKVAGVIPRYARRAFTPELEGTTIMYKELCER